MTPRNYQTKAIVIKKTKLGEADRILTLCTSDRGKIQAVAKGVRRPKSKMAGHLELMTCSQVNLARGRNLDIITGAQTIESFLPLKTDLALASYGLYVIELVNQFTTDQAEDGTIYSLLFETLKNLQETDNRELLLRNFELKLLEIAGFRPQLRSCVSCHHPLAQVINYFNAGVGGMLCPQCSPKYSFSLEVSVNALKVLRFIQNNEYSAVSRLKISSPLARELEVVTRHYLRYILEREVKSAAWLDSLRDQLARPNISSSISTEME
jgi:DNA repair protein RecO (recombination protein O)